MIAEERVQQLAREKVLELGGFLVSAKVSWQNIISVFVDKAVGISIKECLQISRHIENELDREIEDFQLSVSSPGLNKPFVVKEQYLKNIGKEIVGIVENNPPRRKGLGDSYQGVKLISEEQLLNTKGVQAVAGVDCLGRAPDPPDAGPVARFCTPSLDVTVNEGEI